MATEPHMQPKGGTKRGHPKGSRTSKKPNENKFGTSTTGKAKDKKREQVDSDKEVESTLKKLKTKKDDSRFSTTTWRWGWEISTARKN